MSSDSAQSSPACRPPPGSTPSFQRLRSRLASSLSLALPVLRMQPITAMRVMRDEPMNAATSAARWQGPPAASQTISDSNSGDIRALGECLHGLPFVWISRMRATYATLMQGAGIDSILINALQGRSQNSEVLYANYLNPYQQSFLDASQSLNRRLGSG